jgi:alpha-tubulin suppressor-like RCC1 family protein
MDGDTDSLTPEQVPNLDNIIAIAAGNHHNLALKSDRTVWAWGQNHNGQLGSGTDTGSGTPMRVKALTEVTAIAAGDSRNMEITNQGDFRRKHDLYFVIV